MAPTADRVTVTVHTGAQDDVLRITGASGIPYIMTCLPVDQNAPAIFSFWARADAQISVRISALGLTDEITVDENWTRYVFLIEQPTGVTLRLIPQSDTALYLYQGMVESGATKPSDWTPAPEDVDADITAAQTDADAAQVAASAAQAAAAAAAATADALDEIFRMWYSFTDEGMSVQKKTADGKPASIWSTLTDNTGFHIRRSDLLEKVFSAYKDRCRVQKLVIGNTMIKPSGNGGMVWVKAPQD